MKMKIDTQVVFGEDIVLYDPRTDVVLPNPEDEAEDEPTGDTPAADPAGAEGGEAGQ